MGRWCKVSIGVLLYANGDRYEGSFRDDGRRARSTLLHQVKENI